MNGIGFLIIYALLNYIVIRVAVRDGIKDANKSK